MTPELCGCMCVCVYTVSVCLPLPYANTVWRYLAHSSALIHKRAWGLCGFNTRCYQLLAMLESLLCSNTDTSWIKTSTESTQGAEDTLYINTGCTFTGSQWNVSIPKCFWNALKDLCTSGTYAFWFDLPCNPCKCDWRYVRGIGSELSHSMDSTRNVNSSLC